MTMQKNLIANLCISVFAAAYLASCSLESEQATSHRSTQTGSFADEEMAASLAARNKATRDKANARMCKNDKDRTQGKRGGKGTSTHDDSDSETDGSSGSSGSTTPPDSSGTGSTGSTPSSGTAFLKANLTNFESYPDPGSEECLEYNGCKWSGQFAALEEKQPLSWVKANNIAAVHSKDFEKYKLKTLRLKSGSKQIDVKVYDMCSDSDCNGCCTANSKETGFLLDLEKYTAERFGAGDGIVEFTCLDCK